MSGLIPCNNHRLPPDILYLDYMKYTLMIVALLLFFVCNKDSVQAQSNDPGYIYASWTEIGEAIDKTFPDATIIFTKQRYVVPNNLITWQSYYEGHIQKTIYSEACRKAAKRCQTFGEIVPEKNGYYIVQGHERCLENKLYCSTYLWALRAVNDASWMVNPEIAIGMVTGVSGAPYKDFLWWNIVATYQNGQIELYLMMPDSGERAWINGIPAPEQWGVFKPWDGWKISFILL